MNFNRFLYTDVGKNLISVILGIGLASLFQKVCKDQSCIVFTSPIITDIRFFPTSVYKKRLKFIVL